MSRSSYDAAHINCPVAGETVAFVVHDGPMICPTCRKLVEAYAITGAEFENIGKQPSLAERSR